MNQAKNKKCKECGDKYTPIRQKQRFCKQQCRNRFNNRKYRKAVQETKAIDTVLHRNHQLLKHFGESDQAIKEMRMYGFDLQHYTHTARSKKGTILFYVYDYGFFIINQGTHIRIFQPSNQ